MGRDLCTFNIAANRDVKMKIDNYPSGNYLQYSEINDNFDSFFKEFMNVSNTSMQKYI